MPRRRRRIISNGCYEIGFRAKNCLPLVAYQVIALIIGSALARAQRDNKVILCHDIWNGSHSHLIVVAKDAQQLVNFYSEVQKKITDCLKRLLGLSHLQIWEGYPMVAQIMDLEKAKERIAYLYANPAQDNLVEHIENFPGYSSWNGFSKNTNSIAAETKEVYPWIRLPTIPILTSPILTTRQDENVVRLIKFKNKKRHLLLRHPNSWMHCFGITCDKDVNEINQDIISAIRSRETSAEESRVSEQTTLMGSIRLRSQPILKLHRPKKRDRKVFILTSINELRIKFLEQFEEFCAICKQCYRNWKCGDYSVKWPPGAFKPPAPPNINLLQITI